MFGSDLKGLTKIDYCFQLTELWLCETGLEKVPDFSECLNIQKLFLYENNLTFVANIDQLTNLQVNLSYETSDDSKY